MAKQGEALPKKDHFQAVTDAIIAQLEQGTLPWEKPWAAGDVPLRPLRTCGTPYRGINILLLWSAAMAGGYSSPYWMTFRQAKERAASVRKGERGTSVFYAGMMEVEGENTEDDGDDDARAVRFFMKHYTVFNAEQIDGLDAAFFPAKVDLPPAAARIAEADVYFDAIPSDVRHGGGRAFYTPDYIRMPPFEAFADPERYYSTIAHEHIHWTKGPGRLDRDFGRKRWGDEGYAMEELVAELGAAFVCSALGFRPDHIEDHASYIDSWLKVLKGDKRAIFTAASHAQKAFDLLDGYQAECGMMAAAQ
ncbi:MAG: zincin-like metallopeptidase domain-containing protein [Parvibaculum sp.]